MMQLVQVAIGIVVTILVIIALFSVFPTVVGNFNCPATIATTNTNATTVNAWITGCNTIQTQTTIVPTLLALAVIIAVLVILAKIMT